MSLKGDIFDIIFSHPRVNQIRNRYYGDYSRFSYSLGRIPRNGKMIFQVVGLPRSGTTLLALIIDNHSEAVCLIEPFLSWLSRGIFDVKIMDTPRFLTQFRLLPPHKIIGVLCKNSSTQAIGFKETFRTQAQNLPTDIFLMQNAADGSVDQTIVIVRDPRDGWASNLKRDDNTQLDSQAFLGYLNAWNRLGEWIINDNLLMMRYEDLVLTPQTLRKVFDPLGLNYSEELLARNETKSFLGDSNALSGGKMFTTSIGRYKSNLKDSTIKAIQDQCSEYLSLFGYGEDLKQSV